VSFCYRGVQSRLKSQRVETVTDAVKQPPRSRYVNYETVLKPNSLYSVHCPAYRMCKDSSMFELIIAVIALCSASIFLAHAVEAYLT
jgi:hypothetical protein